MRERTLELGKAGISREAYRELLHFCRQLEEKKRRLSHLRGWGGPDWERARLERDVALIARLAREAAGEALEQALVLNVCYGVRFEALGAPCGRRQFYEMRRRFFTLLARAKWGPEEAACQSG
ncbi:Uncharacterised protein [uncultured Clostridium sp.]|nr:Uncharacterised protein [uncultured Clostridium sp.]